MTRGNGGGSIYVSATCIIYKVELLCVVLFHAIADADFQIVRQDTTCSYRYLFAMVFEVIACAHDSACVWMCVCACLFVALYVCMFVCVFLPSAFAAGQ